MRSFAQLLSRETKKKRKEKKGESHYFRNNVDVILLDGLCLVVFSNLIHFKFGYFRSSDDNVIRFWMIEVKKKRNNLRFLLFHRNG